MTIPARTHRCSGVVGPVGSHERRRSGQQTPVLLACGHGVDDELVAALEDKDDSLEQTSVGVEAESQLAVRPAVVLERLDPLPPVRGVKDVFFGDAVLERAGG